MNHDLHTNFYTKRTQKLLLSGYPIEITVNEICTVESRPDDALAMHWHDEVEFQHIMNGHARITCCKKQISANRGDIIFINQSAEHQIMPAGNDTVTLRSIIIHPTFILGFDQSDLINKYITPVISNNTFHHLHISHDSRLHQQFAPLLEQLTMLNSTHSSGYELLSKACVLQLWKLVYDQLPHSTLFPSKTALRTASQDAYRAREAILYIQEHFMEPLTLDNIADSILVSKSECCRCFKRATGLSPFEYLMKYRIIESTLRMKHSTNESISEIAGAVGFNSTSYYNKVFKKFMGCTPSEYRQSLSPLAVIHPQ